MPGFLPVSAFNLNFDTPDLDIPPIDYSTLTKPINIDFGGYGGGSGSLMNTGRLALGGLQTIGQLWGAFQANKLANKQFDFTKRLTNANLANQIKSFNTSLEDRARSRAVVEEQTPEQTSAYLSSHRLPDQRI